MAANRLTEGTALVGDVLLDNAKLDKSIKIRIGTGGTAVGTSETTVTSPYAVLPAQAAVYDVFLNVLTASTGATKTIGIGLLSTSSGGNRTGFLAAASVASTGLVLGTVATGTSGAGTYGAFLTTQTTGNAPVQKTFSSDSITAKTLSFTPNSSEWIAFSADLYVCYVDVTR